MRIAVLGATGTIGAALVPLLAEEHEVVAISRRPHQPSNGVRWAQADATDAASVQKAFEGIDVAYYLVHSLGSSDFAERDRLAASVVARAAETRRVATAGLPRRTWRPVARAVAAPA